MNKQKLEEILTRVEKAIDYNSRNNPTYQILLLNREIIEALLEDPKPTNKGCCTRCDYQNGNAKIHYCICHSTKEVPSWEEKWDSQFHYFIENYPCYSRDMKKVITTLLKQKDDIINELRNN